jgi:hypothetical protein
MDQSEARQGLEILRAEAAAAGKRMPVRVYPCDVCRLWYLTSKPNRGRTPVWDRDPSWQRPHV